MDIIKAILDIEEKAQKIVGTLDDIKAESERETEAEIKLMSEDMKARAEAEIEKSRAEAESDLARLTAECDEDMRRRQEVLDKNFEDNRERWIKEITDAVVRNESL